MAEYKFVNEKVTTDAGGQVLTVDQLRPVQPIKLPDNPVTPSTSDSLVASLEPMGKSLGDYITSLTPPETALDQTQNSIIGRINELLPQSGGKQQALAQEQQKAGIPQLQQRLQDLNNQLLTGNAAYAQMVADFQAKQAGTEADARGITTGVLSGQLGANARLFEAQKASKAAEQGMIAAQAQATSGNINTAIQLAQNAVEARFAPIEDELRIRQAQLDSILPLLNKQEKIQHEAKQRQYQDQQQALADRKEKEKTVQNIAMEAAKFGADSDMVSRLQKAGSISQALSMAAPFLSAEFKQKVDQQKFENRLNLQQLAISRANLAVSQGNLALSRRKQDFEEAQAKGLISPDGKVSPELLAFAQQYAADGKIPTGMPKGTFGIVSQVAKDLPKQNGTLVDRNTGITPAGAEAKTQAYGNLYSTVELAKQLKQLDTKRWGGVTAGVFGKVFGSDNQQRYVDLRSQIVDLLARARTGAALTESEERFYKGMLPGRFDEPLGFGADSDVRIDNFINNLTSDLNNKLASQGWAIYGVSKINLEGKDYTVGDIISNGEQQARINADGTLTPL